MNTTTDARAGRLRAARRSSAPEAAASAAIVLPGYLLLDYARDLRLLDKFSTGGSGVIYRGTLLNPGLRAKLGVETVRPGQRAGGAAAH